MGIVPAMAAGPAARIDIEIAPTAASIWRFAGLDPSVVLKRGERRPRNPSLKTVCVRIGHTKLETTSEYYVIDPDRERTQVNRMIRSVATAERKQRASAAAIERNEGANSARVKFSEAR